MTRKTTPARQTPRREAARKLNEGLRHELRRFPADKVAAFVRSVGATLGEAEILAEASDVAKWRSDLLRLDDAAAEFAAEVAVLRRATPLPPRVESLDDPAAFGDPSDAEFYRANHEARAALKKLREQIARSLTRAPARRRGRREAAAQGVLAVLARRYLELFGERPRSTPGGTFANVAALVLENLHGSMPADVSRQVRAAIKSL